MHNEELIVGAVREHFGPSKELLCLVEDELDFMHTLDEAGAGDQPVRPSVYAVYVGDVPSLTVNGLVDKVNDYICDAPKSKRTRKKTTLIRHGSVALHPVEIGEFLGGIRTGSKCRNCEMAIGCYYSTDGGLESGSDTPKWSLQTRNIVYKSDLWDGLLAKLNGDRHKLRTFTYALACAGQTYGLMARLENICKKDLDVVKWPATRKAWEYAFELVHRMHLVDGWEREKFPIDYKSDIDFCWLKQYVDSCSKQIKHVCKTFPKKRKVHPTTHVAQFLDTSIASLMDEWLSEVRDSSCSRWAQTTRSTLNVSDDGATDAATASSALDAHLELIGSKVKADAVDFMIQSGSAMYNLATAASDADYFVVFSHSTRDLLNRSPPSNSFSKHVAAKMGANKAGEVECTGREIGSFIVDLTKGNPQVIELLYVCPAMVIHESPLWMELRKQRNNFVTQRCVSQYIGFIDNRLHHAREIIEETMLVDGKLPADQERAVSKLLYHAFHKIGDLERIVLYEDPVVTLPNESELRSYIMSVRTTKPLSGTLTPTKLLQEAKSRRDRCVKLRDINDAARTSSGQNVRPMEVDINLITEILTKLRMSKLSSQPRLIDKSFAVNANEPATALDVAERLETGDDAQVKERLARLASDEGGTIIYAAECSSRALGTNHSGSDHDIVAIIAYPPERYFSICPLETKIRRIFEATPDVQEIDVTLFECRHAFTLLAESNLTLLEAMLSPKRYFADTSLEDGEMPEWVKMVIDESSRLYDRSTVAKAAFSHAQGNYKVQIERRADGEFPKKKYIHVCRRLMLVLWLLDPSHVWPPPVNVRALFASVPNRQDGDEIGITTEVRSRLESMLAPSEIPKLGQPTLHDSCLDGWIVNQLRLLKVRLFSKENNTTRSRNRLDSSILHSWDCIMIPLLQEYQKV